MITPSDLQIKARLTPEELDRLDKIIKKCKFKSRYHLLRFILKCFLRVADPQVEAKSDDVEEMFEGYKTPSFDDFQGTKRKTSI